MTNTTQSAGDKCPYFPSELSPDVSNDEFHYRWTQCVGKEGYVKQDWMDAERHIFYSTAQPPHDPRPVGEAREFGDDDGQWTKGELNWDEYPLGTKAQAQGGGYWIRVAHGWKWFNGSTFPTPGGDATGRVCLPAAPLEPQGELKPCPVPWCGMPARTFTRLFDGFPFRVACSFEECPLFNTAVSQDVWNARTPDGNAEQTQAQKNTDFIASWPYGTPKSCSNSHCPYKPASYDPTKPFCRDCQFDKMTVDSLFEYVVNQFACIEIEDDQTITQERDGNILGALERIDNAYKSLTATVAQPVDMLLFCPNCGEQHVDEAAPDICEDCGIEELFHSAESAVNKCAAFNPWLNPPHKSHRCKSCNWVWRPSDVPTNGVAAIKTKGANDQSAFPSSTTIERDMLWPVFF